MCTIKTRSNNSFSKTRVFSNCACRGAQCWNILTLQPPTPLPDFYIEHAKCILSARGFHSYIFYLILPSPKKVSTLWEKSQNGLGRGVVPTTFTNSAKPSQTFKNDAFQGKLYKKSRWVHLDHPFPKSYSKIFLLVHPYMQVLTTTNI